jgi:hypothetical protein
MLDTPCCEVVWRVLATHSIRQFPLLHSSYIPRFFHTPQIQVTYCILHLTKRVLSPDKCPTKSPCVLTPDDVFYISRVLNSPKYNAEHRVRLITSTVLWKRGWFGVTIQRRQRTSKLRQNCSLQYTSVWWQMPSRLDCHFILLNLNKTYTSTKICIKNTIFPPYSVLSATLIQSTTGQGSAGSPTNISAFYHLRLPSPVFSLRPPPTKHTAFRANENYRFPLRERFNAKPAHTTNSAHLHFNSITKNTHLSTTPCKKCNVFNSK